MFHRRNRYQQQKNYSKPARNSNAYIDPDDLYSRTTRSFVSKNSKKLADNGGGSWYSQIRKYAQFRYYAVHDGINNDFYYYYDDMGKHYYSYWDDRSEDQFEYYPSQLQLSSKPRVTNTNCGSNGKNKSETNKTLPRSRTVREKNVIAAVKTIEPRSSPSVSEKNAYIYCESPISSHQHLHKKTQFYEINRNHSGKLLIPPSSQQCDLNTKVKDIRLQKDSKLPPPSANPDVKQSHSPLTSKTTSEISLRKDSQQQHQALLSPSSRNNHQQNQTSIYQNRPSAAIQIPMSNVEPQQQQEAANSV
ncbi:unnamed protein product, partial [Didymodactylos carnosus]